MSKIKILGKLTDVELIAAGRDGIRAARLRPLHRPRRLAGLVEDPQGLSLPARRQGRRASDAPGHRRIRRGLPLSGILLRPSCRNAPPAPSCRPPDPLHPADQLEHGQGRPGTRLERRDQAAQLVGTVGLREEVDDLEVLESSGRVEWRHLAVGQADREDDGPARCAPSMDGDCIAELWEGVGRLPSLHVLGQEEEEGVSVP